MSSRLTQYILIAMLFLRLIRMIIAPLVFATLVGGIARAVPSA
ncbi:MAG: hypothetical protein PS018_04640 [bacterium]|nr:hypothetical protein [bacterium]